MSAFLKRCDNGKVKLAFCVALPTGRRRSLDSEPRARPHTVIPMSKHGFTTTILHADRRLNVEHGAVHKPIHTSSQYGYRDARDLAAVFQGKAGFSYARQGPPTTDALEKKITGMEGGIASISFATGMAALSALFTTLLRAGDHLISSQFIFGNTNSLFGTLQLLGIEVTLVDPTDLAAVSAAIRPGTRMIFSETIANPGTQVADLEGLGEICRAHGLVYVVDNTVTSPCLFLPRDVGASLVMNSLSKHIGGHAHALGGSLTDTGLFDWSSYPNILDIYKKGAPASWGLTPRSRPMPRTGLRSAPRRWRFAWKRFAAMQWRWRHFSMATLASRVSHILALRRIRSTRLRDGCSRAATACCSASNLPMASTVLTSSINSRSSCWPRTWAIRARSHCPRPTRFTTRWGPSCAHGWESLTA